MTIVCPIPSRSSYIVDRISYRYAKGKSIVYTPGSDDPSAENKEEDAITQNETETQHHAMATFPSKYQNNKSTSRTFSKTAGFPENRPSAL